MAKKTTEVPPDPEPEPLDDERLAEIERRRKAAKRSGLEGIDVEVFAVGDTPLSVLRLCVRKGATVEQIRKICL